MKTYDDETFYIGYLPASPSPIARFTRKVVGASIGVALGVAVLAAGVLPYFGSGVFEFGRPQNISGALRCDSLAPRLSTPGTDYLLVGYGKHGVPPEICGAEGTNISVYASLIEREGRRLLEVTQTPQRGTSAALQTAAVSLGRLKLVGEIVDSKCYFGVMNPAEGRLHRACAELCLRGGVPAVFVVRDKAGNVAHLLIDVAEWNSSNERLLSWVGESVEVFGEVSRQGQWLVLRPELGSLRFATK